MCRKIEIEIHFYVRHLLKSQLNAVFATTGARWKHTRIWKAFRRLIEKKAQGEVVMWYRSREKNAFGII